MLLNNKPCVGDGSACIHTRYTGAKELVKNTGDTVYMKCAATGGGSGTQISWTFTSRYLISKGFHCKDAPLPAGCSSTFNDASGRNLSSYCPMVGDDNEPSLDSDGNNIP